MKKIKTLILALCITLTFSTNVFAATDTGYTDSSMSSAVQQLVSELDSMTIEELEYYADNVAGFTKKACESYGAFVKEDQLGDIKGFDGYNVNEEDNAVIFQQKVNYEKADLDVTVTFKTINGSLTPIDMEFILTSLSEDNSFGAKMKKAALNTLIGMGTVFLVLIFISFLISLFKYVNRIESNYSARKNAGKEAAEAVDNTIAQITQKEENEMDDLELVAVITAAIAASQGTSSDGFRVRSIKRVSR